MKPAPPPMTPHRLARLTAWVRLWLQGFAAVVLVLMFANPAALKHRLNWVSRRIGELVFVHVALRVRPRTKWKRRAGEMRALIGSHLRKSLRRRGVVEHFFAILEVMRDLETHVCRLAKRLAPGLTRRSPKPPAREHGVLALTSTFPTLTPAADTS